MRKRKSVATEGQLRTTAARRHDQTTTHGTPEMFTELGNFFPTSSDCCFLTCMLPLRLRRLSSPHSCPDVFFFSVVNLWRGAALQTLVGEVKMFERQAESCDSVVRTRSLCVISSMWIELKDLQWTFLL